MAACATIGATARPAAAVEPLRFGGLQLTLGGEVSGSLAPPDNAHFNQGEYDLSLLRLFRLGMSAELKAGPHLAVLGDVRSDNLDGPHMYALYLRARPWRERAFDVQAGMVPPVFGAFARRYAADPALIGYPLAYHYPTLVRPDAAPRDVSDLLRQRGNGWATDYPIGASSFDRGLPLVEAQHWDSGVQVRLGGQPWQLSAAVTQGTLGNPLVRDDNASKQIAARMAWRSSFGLEAGVSAARGGYVSRDLLDEIPEAGHRFQQRVLGVDLEHAWDHWIVRGEAIWSSWDAVAQRPPLLGSSLTASGVSVEVRYRPWPGVSLASRYDRLGFGDVPGPAGPTRWDAALWRVETGAGYLLRRNLAVKLAYQHDRRDTTTRELLAVQGLAWF